MTHIDDKLDGRGLDFPAARDLQFAGVAPWRNVVRTDRDNQLRCSLGYTLDAGLDLARR